MDCRLRCFDQPFTRDVWETFDALDRARDRYAGLNVRFAIVALPNGKVLAASDPAKFPVQSAVPPDVERRFPAEDGLIIDTASGSAWLARSLREEGFSVGRILAEIDISELLRVRKTGVADAPCRQRMSRARICDNRLFRAQAHAETPKRTQWIRGARSSRTRGPHSGVRSGNTSPASLTYCLIVSTRWRAR